MIQTDFHRREFADGEELAQGLADWTAEHLREAIAARGVALLIVSGGKSPARFFDLLSNIDLDWPRVAITLADERRVADDSPRSNARLVREKLLQNRAQAASFTPLADVRLPGGPGAGRSQRAHRQFAFASRCRGAGNGRRRAHRLVVSRRRWARRSDGSGGSAARRSDRARQTPANRASPSLGECSCARGRSRSRSRARQSSPLSRPRSSPARRRRCPFAPCCDARPIASLCSAPSRPDPDGPPPGASTLKG